MYRSTPLRGLWQHAPYFHNGVTTTLDGVVELYNTRKALNLTAQQKADLVQYLKSLWQRRVISSSESRRGRL